MRVTEEEHALWDLKSIRAFTVTDADLKASKLHRERTRKTAKRRADGVVSRGEYLARSKSRSKPWEAAGYRCRRTWERHLKAGTLKNVASPSPHKRDSYRADTLATRPSPPIAINRASAIDLDTIAFSTFGIVAIRVMRGTEIVRAWNAP